MYRHFAVLWGLKAMADVKRRFDGRHTIVNSDIREREPRVRRRRCEFCGEWYPTDEVQPDIDDEGRILGWFCDSCI